MIRRFITAGAVTVLVLVCLICYSTPLSLATADNQTTQTAPAQTTSTQTQWTFNQAEALADLRNEIADKKDKTADEVFMNIQIFKDVTAEALLNIMENGFSKSLGVNCTYCHIPNHWEDDDKPTKQIARDMSMMSRTINNDLLKKIKNLKSENPRINCTTCHRGQTKPATELK